MIDFSNDIQQCLNTLSSGGIIVYPTDTIWGIGCDATNADAVNKIFKLKRRAEEKSMIVLLADERDIIRYVTQPDLQVFDFLQHTSKPTTVIYEGAVGLAGNCINKDGSIAIRITNDLFCKTLIKRFRKPIISTSANLAGYPAPQHFNDIVAEIKNGADYIVQHRQNDLTPTTPSAIIKWNKDGSHLVIRN